MIDQRVVDTVESLIHNTTGRIRDVQSNLIPFFNTGTIKKVDAYRMFNVPYPVENENQTIILVGDLKLRNTATPQRKRAVFKISMLDAINENIRRAKLRSMIYKKGVKTLFQDGLLKVIDGITTMEEVFRLVDVEDDLDNIYGRDDSLLSENKTFIEEQIKEKENNDNVVINNSNNDQVNIEDDKEQNNNNNIKIDDFDDLYLGDTF